MQREPASTAAPKPKLVTVQDVAEMLNISSRHVYRLVDSGRMPRPIKLGGANRWNREVIERWIRDDCPSVRNLPHLTR